MTDSQAAASLTDDARRTAMIRVALESWRLLRHLEHVARNLDHDQQKRLASRLEFFNGILRESLDAWSLKTVDFTGSSYFPGLPVTAVNGDDFPPDAQLVITQQLEPTIVGEAGLVRRGTVVVDERTR